MSARAKIASDESRHAVTARAKDLRRRLGALGPLEDSSRETLATDEEMAREVLSLRFRNVPEEDEEEEFVHPFHPRGRQYGAPRHVDAALMVQAVWKLRELRKSKRKKAWRLQHGLVTL